MNIILYYNTKHTYKTIKYCVISLKEVKEVPKDYKKKTRKAGFYNQNEKRYERKAERLFGILICTDVIYLYL